MKIGTRIRIFRKSLHMTQDKLAELSGIHPVSIRKYETEAMDPQPEQIQKLADTLGVTYNALTGVGSEPMRLEGIGDLNCFFLLMLNSRILIVNGERGKNDFLKPETMTITVNPKYQSYFNIQLLDKRRPEPVPTKNVSFSVTSKEMISDILRWEKLNYYVEMQKERCEATSSEREDERLDFFKDMKELTEMDMQTNNNFQGFNLGPLNFSFGSVPTLPNYKQLIVRRRKR